MVINKKIYKWSRYREKETAEFSVLNGTVLSYPSQTQGSLSKRHGKIVRAKVGMITRKE